MTSIIYSSDKNLEIADWSHGGVTKSMDNFKPESKEDVSKNSRPTCHCPEYNGIHTRKGVAKCYPAHMQEFGPVPSMTFFA